MAVTIYRSTDSGAPALPANANYVGASFYMDIIKKCLVDGYGSKAGAGWSLVYEDTTANKRRLAVSNGNGVLEFITWGTRSIGMVMWDSITTPGVGRINDDTFANVMSSGVNGWKSAGVAAPGSSGGSIAGINLSTTHIGNSGSIAWTVFANDKSAWILFHYPSGSSSAEPGDDISLSSSLHNQIFMGAVKSPDLDRDQAGNFFLLNGSRAADTNANINATGSQSISFTWGLRTPMNTLPQTANNSAYNYTSWARNSVVFISNPLSSVRVIIPALITYVGSDVPKPASQALSAANYAFGAIPGLGQLSDHGTTAQTNFWVLANLTRGATWNMQPYTINGVDWMPWPTTTGEDAFALSDNEDWWV